MNRNVSVKNAKAQTSTKELTHALKSTWTIIVKSAPIYRGLHFLY